jgi:hypothetical protein
MKSFARSAAMNWSLARRNGANSVSVSKELQDWYDVGDGIQCGVKIKGGTEGAP